MTDEEMHADKGEAWRVAHSIKRTPLLESIAEDWLEAMHDRDGLHAERNMWREECLQMTAEALR